MPGKQYLNVLDFIGNYEKAGRTHLLFGGGTDISGNRPGDGDDVEYPDDKENPFRGYMDFLHGLQELSADEEAVYAGLGREFLSKAKSMPVKFLKASGKGGAGKEGYVLAIWEELADVAENAAAGYSGRLGSRGMVREAKKEDLGALLNLYLFLHEDSIPEQNAHLEKTWNQIMEDANHHLIVNEIDGQIVSSCVCVIIPNLTRNIRPYAFIENVVTHVDHRGKGYASECLDYARQIAEKEECYKMMLLTGSKKSETMRFYERAGYNSSDKTAFIQWLGIERRIK